MRGSNHQAQDVLGPFKGLDSTTDPVLIDSSQWSGCQNVIPHSTRWGKRSGYGTDGNALPVSDYSIVQIIDFNGTRLAITTRDVFAYSGGNWHVLGLTLQDCESSGDWTPSANVTAADSTDGKKGTYSLQLTVADGFTTGILAYTNFGSMSLLDRSAVGFWIKSTVSLDSGDLSIVVSESADGAKSGTYSEINIPAISSDTWTYCRISNDFSDHDSVVSLGVYQNVDKGSVVIKIDDIKALRSFSGTTSNRIDWVIAASPDWGERVVITNGVNPIITWNGSSEDYDLLIHDYPGLASVGCVGVLRSHLVFGNITTDGLLVESFADSTNWTPSANVTVEDDITTAIGGGIALELTIASGFTTGILAYRNITAVDLSTYDGITVWVKSSTDQVKDSLSIVLSESANGAKSGDYTEFVLPGLTGGQWTKCVIPISVVQDSVVSIGLWALTDPGTTVLTFDELWTTGGTQTNEPKLVAWSDANDFEEWIGGEAGEDTLTESKGTILRMVPFGNKLISYSEQSLSEIQYIGGDAVFGFWSLIQGIGIVGPRSICSIGPYHVLATSGEFLLFDGTCVPRQIARQVEDDYRSMLFSGEEYSVEIVYDSSARRLFIIVPTGESSRILYSAEIDYLDLSRIYWSKHSFADNPVGFVASDGILYFGSSSQCFLFEDNLTDNGSVITAIADTKDFSAPQEYIGSVPRWLEIEIEAKGSTGSSMLVYYSTDQGFSWVLASTETLTTSWAHYSVEIDIVSTLLRVRVCETSADKDLQVRWTRVWCARGGVNR